MDERRVLDGRTVLCVLAALAVGMVIVTGDAFANPLPDSALLIHVHSWDPGFCQDNPISNCDEVVQYAEISPGGLPLHFRPRIHSPPAKRPSLRYVF
jgi:hypothetical protein